MGAETSKEQDYYVPSQDKNTYENVVRAYATWDHRSGLASHDASRFTNHEVYNLNKHHQLSQNSSDQQKPIPSNITKRPSLHQHKKPNHSHSKKTYDDQIKQDKTVPLKENQSINQESYSKNVVTAEQLMKTHSQRKQRYRSTPSPSSNETSQNSPIVKPSTNINQFISSNKKQTQVPNNLQLVLINQSDLQVKFNENDSRQFSPHAQNLMIFLINRMLVKLVMVISVLFIMHYTKLLVMLH